MSRISAPAEPSRRMTDEELDAIRSPLPDTNCFRCGARGWCEHRRPNK